MAISRLRTVLQAALFLSALMYGNCQQSGELVCELGKREKAVHTAVFSSKTRGLRAGVGL